MAQALSSKQINEEGFVVQTQEFAHKTVERIRMNDRWFMITIEEEATQ